MERHSCEGRRDGASPGRFAALAGLAMLLLCDCSSLRVYTAKNPATSFGGYRTYAHGAPESAPPGFARTPLTSTVLAKVQVDVDRELADKGYTMAGPGAAPDLLVRSGSGRRTQERNVGGKVSEDIDWIDAEVTSYYSEATLTIDVFDAHTQKLVWHGSSRREMDTAAGVRDASLAEAVTAILRTFPKATAAAAPAPNPSGADHPRP